MMMNRNDMLTVNDEGACPLVFNDKFIDTLSFALDDRVHLLVNEGVAQSGKTAASISAFFEAVQESYEDLHLIAAWDLNAIEDKILNKKDIGLLRLYSNYCSMKKEEIGSYYVNVRCDLGEKRPKWKKILLCGFADASKWQKILGKTLGVILIDEVNTANESFVNECFARQLAVKRPFQIWTLNGDVPTKWVYTNYINKCRILKKRRVPSSIIADMDKADKRDGWYYQHWGFHDNPILTDEQIERAMSVYPVGSFYYTTKILGERGAPGSLIYIDYIRPTLIHPVEKRDYQRYIIGCDIGATRAMNSYTLTGFSYDYYKMAYFDKRTFKGLGYEQKKIELIALTRRYIERGFYIEYITIDSAEANFIRDLQTEFTSLGLPPVIPSYKATIKERIDAMIILASSGRVAFNDTIEGRDLYDAFLMAKWSPGREGIEREDLNEPHNDKIDSAEYSFTKYMKQLMRAER
jgi:hypothetical protein